LRASEAVVRKPWILPFIAAIALGARGPGEAARMLGVPRRLAASGLYAVRRMGVDLDAGLPCIVVKNRFYASIVGSIVVVAKVGRRRVKAYTVPYKLLKSGEAVGGKLGYRVKIAKWVLENGTPLADCGS
jgi:hypothetical protein